MTDADELRKLIHKMQQDNAAGGIERFRDVRSFRYQDVEDLVNAAGSLLDDRDRLAAENADLKAIKVAYEEAPKDARNATTAGVTWETLQGTVGRVIDSQTIRDLRAENARLRAALERIVASNASFVLGQIAADALTRKEG